MTTKTKHRLIKDITQGSLQSAYLNAPFDEGLDVLQRKGYDLITLQQEAQLRIDKGPIAVISRYGNWVLEDVLYIPKRKPLLTRMSPIAKNPIEATQAHREGRDFYLTDKQVDECLARDYVELTQEEIPTNRFNEHAVTQFAFGKHAKNYGNFLREFGIKKMPMWLADIQDKPFARKMWLWRLDYGSVLDGNDRYLYGGNFRVRGVRLESDEAAAQNNFPKEVKVEAYMPQQISEVLKKLNISGLEESILSELRNQ